MENRLHLDVETEIPLGLIEQAPWNPKIKISGIYWKGLENSLETFGNRDRLHVWPKPKSKGRYYVLDGNQRLALIHSNVTSVLIREWFGLVDDAKESVLHSIATDPANEAKMKMLHSEVTTFKIPCQVITKLDDDTPFTLDDAKLFTLTWNRNHAKFDEPKATELYKSILADRLAKTSEDRRKFVESRIKAMVRPQLDLVDPPPKSDPVPLSANDHEYMAADIQPTADEPWGPPPKPSPGAHEAPTSVPASSTVPAVHLIPMVFSLTPEGYTAISERILRSKAAMFRQIKLAKALEHLESLIPEAVDAVSDSVIVELALRILELNIEAKSSV